MKVVDLPYRRIMTKLARGKGRFKRKIYSTREEIVITKQATKMINIMGRAIKAGKSVTFEQRELADDEKRSRKVFDVISIEIKD